MNGYAKAVGHARRSSGGCVLTTGTGSIFGFLVARQAYDSALLAPLFIVMSFACGLAVFLLVLCGLPLGRAARWATRVLRRLANLLGVFVAAVAVLRRGLSPDQALFRAPGRRSSASSCVDGGVYPRCSGSGYVVARRHRCRWCCCSTRASRGRAHRSPPAALVVARRRSRSCTSLIIGGQAYPLRSFPGMVASSFFDGVVAAYAPEPAGSAARPGRRGARRLIVAVALRVLALLPRTPGSCRRAARPEVAAPVDVATHAPPARLRRAQVLGQDHGQRRPGAALRARGLAVQPFKKGPDYIDPMWLGAAAGRPCRNLDSVPVGTPRRCGSSSRAMAPAPTSPRRGQQGPVRRPRPATAATATRRWRSCSDLPVVLVIDARGMTRGIAPLILGYQAFDRDDPHRRRDPEQLGGARHEAKLRAVIEHYTDVPVLGAVHDDPRLAIVERHLGLMPEQRGDGARAARRIAIAPRRRRAGRSRTACLRIAAARRRRCRRRAPPIARAAPRSGPPVRIGIARDRAFGFYYAGRSRRAASAPARSWWLRHAARRAAAARRRPVHRRRISRSCSWRELEANAALRGEIRARDRGGPAGLRRVRRPHVPRAHAHWRGDTCRMVGAIPGDVVMHERPVGRGYVHLARPRLSVAGARRASARRCARTSSTIRASRTWPRTCASPTT